MILYKTTARDDIGNRDPIVSWQGSQTDASKARTAAKKEGYKAESQTANVPTAKGPLLDWLNEHVTS